MEIKVFDIGIMQNFAWLVIGDDKNKTTLQVPPEQLEKLANDIIVVLKKYARAKREIYGAMGKELTLSNDQTTPVSSVTEKDANKQPSDGQP